MNITVKFNLLPRSVFAILPLAGADKELDTEDVKADSGLCTMLCSVIWLMPEGTNKIPKR